MKYIGLVIAIVVAMAAAFLVLQNSNNQQQAPTTVVNVAEPAEPAISEVLVYAAARDIAIGTKIDANMITTLKWPDHLIVDGFIRANQGAQNVVGMVARASFRRDEPLNDTKLINPNEPSFLAGELPKGKRVVTIQTDEIEGVAGFVFPGDRVDILVTHRILREGAIQETTQDGDDRENTERATETLLHNIRVLAVDQRATAGTDSAEGVVIPRSVSLEVTPDQAQRIKLGADLGQLSLALRPIEDVGEQVATGVTRQSSLTKGSVASETAPEAKSSAVRVIRGTEVAEETEEE